MKKRFSIEDFQDLTEMHQEELQVLTLAIQVQQGEVSEDEAQTIMEEKPWRDWATTVSQSVSKLLRL